MAVARRKIVDALKQHCDEIDERRPGYRDALLDCVADIIAAEREHMIRATVIQKKITDSCEALGEFLARGVAEQGKAQG